MNTRVHRVRLVARSEWRRGTARVVCSAGSGGSGRGIQKPWCFVCLRDLHISSHSSVPSSRSRSKYSREDESASPAMKSSTACDNCASVENSAYASEHRSVVRAAYAITDSDPDWRMPRRVARNAPSNLNRLKSAISPSQNFSYYATVSATCDRWIFSASSDPSQESTKKPQRSRGRRQNVRNNSASARNARILIPDISVKRCLDATFNSVFRSVAFQAISATAFGYDLEVDGSIDGIEHGSETEVGASDG